MFNVRAVLYLVLFFSLYSQANEYIDESLFALSLEELLAIEVEVASGVLESELEVGSSVSLITREQWQQRGARRTDDALGGLISTIALPTFGGGNALAVRGYATELSVRGIATILDGVPLNTLAFGTSAYDKPNIDLGILQRIETIRGPGSAIYGSDAFHGVVSLKSFSSHQNLTSGELELGHMGYSKANLRVSQGFEHFRIHSAIAYSGQRDENRPYDYTDNDSQSTLSATRDHQYDSQSIVVKINDGKEKNSHFELGYYFNKWQAQEFSGLGTHFYAGASLAADRDFTANQSQFHMSKLIYRWFFANQLSLQATAFYWQNNQLLIYDRTRANDHELFQGAKEHRNGLSLTLRQPGHSRSMQWLANIAVDHAEIDDTREDRIRNDGSFLVQGTASYTGLSRTINSAFIQTKNGYFSEQLYLLLGARLDNYSDFGQQLTPRMGLIWKVTEDSALKLLWGNAFRAGVGAELSGAGVIKGDPKISPETIDTYELIYMKSQPSWKINISYFQSKWQDAIVARPLIKDPDSFTGEYVNRGENSSSGLEMEGQLLLDTLTLAAGMSWVKSASDSEDLDYVAFPEYILNLDIHYEAISRSLSLSVFNRVHLNAQSGPIKNSIPNPAPLDDYFRTDLSVTGHVTKKMDVYFHVQNIFDQNNALPSVWNSEGGITQFGINATAGVHITF